MNKIILINLATTIFVKCVNFFAAPFFSEKLGAANYGIFAVYTSWVSIASIVFTLQAGETVGIAREYFPSGEQARYQSSVLSLATALYIAFSVLAVCLMRLTSGFHHIPMLLTILALLQGWGLYCVGFINGKFIFEFNAVGNMKLSLFVSGLSIGVPVLLLSYSTMEPNYWSVVIGQSFSYGLLGCALFAMIFFKGRTFFNRRYWAFTLPIAVPTVFHLLANIVLHQSDRVMLQAMVSSEAAGVYALSNTFGQVLRSLWDALNKSWTPVYYQYLSKRDTENLRKRVRRYMELFTVLTTGFILMSREVFQRYANESFWGGMDYIPIFAVCHYFTFLYSLPVGYEFFQKDTRKIAMGTSMAAVCNVILNYILIRLTGSVGAVIATMFSHVVLFAFHYINVRRMSSGEFPFTLKELLAGTPLLSLAYLLHAATSELPLIRWSLSFALGLYILIKIIRRKEIF